MEFSASDTLKPYVKGYWVFATDKNLTNETFFPSGFIDFAVNISGGNVTTIIDGRPIDMPRVEILGQITRPTRLIATRGTRVLIARIYPHANTLFFPNPISDFTNDSIDLDDVLGKESDVFYQHLMEAGSIEQQVKVLDNFLLQRLKNNKRIHHKTGIIKALCKEICSAGELFDIKSLSGKYGFTERYIQQLFIDHVGLTPRSFFQVQRFNKSLQLIHAADIPLTSVAYDCGYFDQAHFIREFKKFTGLTPSAAREVYALNQG